MVRVEYVEPCHLVTGLVRVEVIDGVLGRTFPAQFAARVLDTLEIVGLEQPVTRAEAIVAADSGVASKMTRPIDRRRAARRAIAQHSGHLVAVRASASAGGTGVARGVIGRPFRQEER